jgi:hypothetical protein
VGAPAGDGIVDVVDREHDTMQAQRVGRRVVLARGVVRKKIPEPAMASGRRSPSPTARCVGCTWTPTTTSAPGYGRGVKAGGEVGDVPFSPARAQMFLQREAFAELASWC